MNLTALCISLALAGLLHPDAASAEAYRWDSVSVGGGSFVTAAIPGTTMRVLGFDRDGASAAYRWDAQAARWAPMMDWVSEAEAGLIRVAQRPNPRCPVPARAGAPPMR